MSLRLMRGACYIVIGVLGLGVCLFAAFNYRAPLAVWVDMAFLAGALVWAVLYLRALARLVKEGSSMSDKFGRMRPIELDQKISITLPAHVWHGFMASYNSCPWSDMYATAILIEVRDALYDPVFRKEMEAEHQREHTKAERMQTILSRLLPNFPGGHDDNEVPPDAEGLT